MEATRGRCVFCGGFGLSKEHIFPNWLRAYVPRLFDKTVHAKSVTHLDASTSDVVKHRKDVTSRPGDPHARRLRAVCKACNERWMSRLQTAAKKLLVPLIAGHWAPIGASAREVIAAWSAMTTMVVECTHPDTRATIQAEREYLREHRRPPASWAIWLGECQAGRWAHGFNHFGLDRLVEVANGSDGDSTIVSDSGCQTQSTAFVLGRLFLFTYSTRLPDRAIDPTDFAQQHGLRQAWPQTGVPWTKPDRVLNDDDADRISSVFARPLANAGKIRRAWEVDT